MNKNLDLALIRTFATVADGGSMTAAANLLHMTQGAVSQHIKRLEDMLGCALFDRKTRNLELTERGERFLVKARQMLRLNDDILADMTGEPLRGTLRVGVPPDLVAALGPAMKAFGKAHPLVDMSIVCAASPALGEAVDSGQVDLALIEYVSGKAKGEIIRQEPLVWVGGQDSDAFERRPLPLSLIDDRCAFRPIILDTLADAEIAWRSVFESGNIDATAATVRAGLAVTAWLVSTVPNDLKILDPAAVNLPALPPFVICLRLPTTLQPAARDFAQCVREAMSAVTA